MLAICCCIGVPTAANISAAATDVVDHDAPVASAVAVDYAVIAGVGVV